jgi:hypothetical protein
VPQSEVLLDKMRAGKTRLMELRLAWITQQVAAVDEWQVQAQAGGPLALHQSQIEALQKFLTLVLAALTKQVEAAGAAASYTEFLSAAQSVQGLMSRTYLAWHAYQERFTQIKAADPATRRFLNAGDEVAWSGYTVIRKQLVRLGVTSERVSCKQPPLFNLYPALSPITYTRTKGLVIPNLPVHLIDFPLGDLAAPWSLLTILHELAHGIAADIDLSPENWVIRPGAGLDYSRLDQWASWANEIFCDCLAVLLGGPAFVRELMDVLLGMSPGRLIDPARSPHPPPYLRILLLCEFLKGLETKRPADGFPTDPQVAASYADLAEQYAGAWRASYAAAVDPAPFQPYLDEAGLVLGLLMDTPLPELKGATARQLGRFTPADFKLVQRVANNHLKNGEESGEEIPPHLAVGAARVAFDALVAGRVEPELDQLSRSVLKTIEDNVAEGGTRGLMDGEDRVLSDLAASFLAGPGMEDE